MKGVNVTEVPEPVLQERFGLVTETARDNLGAGTYWGHHTSALAGQALPDCRKESRDPTETALPAAEVARTLGPGQPAARGMAPSPSSMAR